jgi:hypothetical protein
MHGRLGCTSPLTGMHDDEVDVVVQLRHRLQHLRREGQLRRVLRHGGLVWRRALAAGETHLICSASKRAARSGAELGCFLTCISAACPVSCYARRLNHRPDWHWADLCERCNRQRQPRQRPQRRHQVPQAAGHLGRSCPGRQKRARFLAVALPHAAVGLIQ